MIKALPDTKIETLLSTAQRAELKLTDLLSYSRQLGLRPAELLNTLSIEAARRFILGEMSFEMGDDIMNGLFTVILDLGMDEQMPQPAFNIYLAFDEGEYQHSGDSEHIKPSECYTRLQLLELLRELPDSD
ncbi:hypothetical protein [Pseudomonas sp. CAM1A]|uniref:hypothetical protein n=1 Tax=Pseudomonas sp. CAM1A TaxID=3231717 RepID=UPI0039C67A0D